MASHFNHIEIPTCSMGEWVLLKMRTFAEEGKVAQIFADDGSSWTYQELLQHSVHVAAGLQSMGIYAGDRVSFVARNSHELYAITFGCLMSGVVVIPSIAELPPSELRRNFLLVRPKFIVAGISSVPAVTDALDGAEELNPKPLILEVKQFFQETISKGAWAKPSTFEPVNTADPRSHVFSFMFSSGTTGKQKAVGMTDYGMLRVMYLASRFKNVGDGPAMSPSQSNWISWWFMIVRSMYRGWTRVFPDKSDTARILDAIHRYKPTILFCAPSMIANMAHDIEENPKRWDLSSIRAVVSGGDMMNKHAHQRFSSKLNLNIYQEYGSTEAGSVLNGRTDLPAVYGSAGRPVVPLKLVDPATGEEILEANKPGEIFVEWYILRDYINNPEATESAFDGNGWFKMGDIAFRNEAGDYFIVDRVKEMFKYCSYQIAPSELEDIIMKVPGIKDTAVVGKYVSVSVGEVPTAFVVKNSGSDVTEQDIHDHLKQEKVHDSMKLRGGVIFTNEIPRNTNGKIVRGKLRDLLNKS